MNLRLLFFLPSPSAFSFPPSLPLTRSFSRLYKPQILPLPLLLQIFPAYYHFLSFPPFLPSLPYLLFLFPSLLIMAGTKYLGMQGTRLQIAIGFLAGMDFLLFGYDQGVTGGLLTLKSFESVFPSITTAPDSSTKQGESSDYLPGL